MTDAQPGEERRYARSVDLCRLLGTLRLSSGRDIRTELQLGGDCSLWDIVEPFLALYRFPLLFSAAVETPPAPSVKGFRFRPLRGRLSRIRDHIVAPTKTSKDCPDWPEGGKTVLFLGFMKTFYRDVLRSVAESLVQDAGCEVVVLGQDHERPEGGIDDRRLRFHSLWAHRGTDVETESRALTRRLNPARTAIAEGMRTAAANGYFPFPLDAGALNAEWSWLFIREFKRLIPYLAVARHILKNHRPILIVSADDADQRCRIFSLAGRASGVPSLLIQQGLTKRTFPEWVFFSQDKVAAMNPSSRSDMIAQGVPPEQIVVTGHPGFDRLLKPATRESETIRSGFGIGAGQKMVLFASQPYYVGVFRAPEIRTTMLRVLVRAAASFENLVLVIKPHPGENPREISGIAGKSPRLAIADKTADIADLIRACDIFATFFSTSAVEALYINKPVINLDFPDSGGSDIFTRSGATWTARSEEDIIRLLGRLAAGPPAEETGNRERARQEFLREMTYIPDGKATARAAHVAGEMIST